MGISNACAHAKVSLKKLPAHLTTGFGIPLLLMDAAEQEVCDVCDTPSGDIHIPDTLGLIAAAAVYRVTIPQRLSGAELKFLRKALKMSSKKLAELLGVTAETLSRCENDRMPMNPTTEKYLRMMAGSLLSDQAPAISFDGKDIVSMKIPTIRGSSEELVMKFGLVKIKSEKKISEVYSEAA
jgi:transcriptional regulator with XRE-family HTH domain